jgi:hypothetical protein
MKLNISSDILRIVINLLSLYKFTRIFPPPSQIVEPQTLEIHLDER